jgi:hypothetical protein
MYPTAYVIVANWNGRVVANRLSFMAEKHGLLPRNHFRARKKRSCEQAIKILVERIYEAWRNRMVVS